MLLVLAVVPASAQLARRTVQDDGARGFQGRLSPELAATLARFHGQAAASQRVPVIVQFKSSPSSSRLQNLARLSGTTGRSLHAVRGGAFSLRLNDLQALANDPNVAYITPDRPVKIAYDYAEQTVGADDAQRYGLDGSGVTVAVIDSGINDNPDLHDPATGLSRVIYNESFVGGTASDGYGHGTHVAGILAGNAQMSGGLGNPRAIYGVAPNVRLVNLRVLDSNGAGKDSIVIAALQRAIALKNTYNIRVVNLSLGRRVYESYKQDPLCQAVEATWRAGIVVVVAAGNWGRDNSLHTSGYGMIASPGNEPYVITVGAMNSMSTADRSDDKIATYSSKGPTLIDHVVKPDLVAPGNKLASLLASGSTLDAMYPGDEVSPAVYGGSGNPKYMKLSGTSMATPIVSGAAALLLEQDPSTTPDVIKARLMKSAYKYFPQYSHISVNGVGADYQYDIFTVGAGYLDIPSALANHDAVNGTSLSPVAVRNLLGTVSLQADGSAIWSSSVIWGNSVVWGNAVLTGSSVIWGNSVVWGNSVLDGCSVIWGNSVIWGSTVDATDAGNEAESIDGSGDDDEI